MSSTQPPLPGREFRAVWVATVGNIDWPSKAGLTTEAQQAEAIRILDTCQRLNMNAVILQVRPQADALYPSSLEPWSAVLSGEQGRAPDPLYDPLAFWLREAHSRGIQVHAWFNPFRALASAKGSVSPQSIIRQRPELVRKLANGMYWMDPADPEVQAHSIAVIMDVLRSYDVDGIHIDDYFYPYPAYNNDADFPDETTWRPYVEAGGKLSRDDWRRTQINGFVDKLYTAIKKEKKLVEFGISPFGIWRPGNPPSIRGLDPYSVLYADARLWLQNGWLDYCVPQLYWPIAQTPQSFPVLLDWWEGQNLRGRNLWPGLFTVKPSMSADEIAGQVLVSRGMLGDRAGAVHYSAKALLADDKGMSSRLQALYAEPALRPTAPWLDAEAPHPPTVGIDRHGNGTVALHWQAKGPKAAFWWLVSSQRDGAWQHDLLPGSQLQLVLSTPLPAAVFVRAVDRLGNVSTAQSVFVDHQPDS